MQIYEFGLLAEIRANPMCDVIDRENANPLEVS